MMSIFNNNNFDPFGTNSLFADINNTNQQINSMNLPSFAKEEEEKKRKKAEQMMKLQNLADTFNMVNAQKSGNAQGVALYSNRMKQRQLEQEEAKAKAEKKAQQELLKQQQDAFLKANPEYAEMIQMNQLFGIKPSSNKLTKSDFVVEILEKIKNNPGYKLTDTDQRILDTISDTDPMKILIRNRLNEMQVNNFDNQNTTQTGPVTVTTQEEFDALPSGSLFIEDGKTYRKP